ncbi:MAG: enoyl-CoA hydratase-related protein [Planctomycetes bacterium]|nr:enoyl-CoA hydratase-related protein [Planctomycetota bacterium]
MTFETLQLETADFISTLRLNRPEKRNSLSSQMLSELTAALKMLDASPETRVIVLAANGKVWCAGADLSQMHAAGEERKFPPASFKDLNVTMWSMKTPIVAKIHGHALAGATSLVMGSHVAIAGESAGFGVPEVNVGVFPMMVMAGLFRNVSRKRALELVLTGERIGASEAERIGWITRCVPDDKLDAEVDRVAKLLASKSPAVLGKGLEAYYQMLDKGFDAGLGYLEGKLVEVFSLEDSAEGLSAFLEKRDPVWRGK